MPHWESRIQTRATSRPPPSAHLFHPNPILTTCTPKMTPPSLPQEIIDKVIDQFSETTRWNFKDRGSNKRVLASLSMVARAWRERSQKHLFSVIEFRKLPQMDITKADLDELGPVLSLTRDLNIDACREGPSRFDPMAIALLRCF